MKAKNKELKSEGRNGLLKPKKVKCFKCDKKFFIKFVIPKQDYSQKNNLGHWTQRDSDKNQEWCNNCILELYNNKFIYWNTIKNLKRRQQMRKYIYDGKFSD